jgi:predicted metal-binding membrane protein
MKTLLYAGALTLSFSGLAFAGFAVSAPSVSVPTFTPWGTLITAAVLGASGIYAVTRKKK